MKKQLLLLMIFSLVTILSACTNNDIEDSTELTDTDTTETETTETNTEIDPDELFNPTHIATITMDDGGQIVLELYGNIAPKTVENFEQLANHRFYDGLTFHRIISGFMIQGGDPNGNGTGGSKKKIVGEFASNGHPNPLLHQRGVISMARSNDKNSASSQFFIVHEDSPHLDGNYASFGRVINGMDVVDKIAAVPVNFFNDRPFEPVIIESIRVEENK